MLTSDLIFGFILTKLFSKPETRSPSVVFPPGTAPTVPPSTSTPPTTSAPPTTSTPPATVPVTLPPAPPFPSQVTPPAPTPQTAPPPAGFKKGIEVWIIKPELAKQGDALVVGNAELGATALQLLEAQFPKGWQGAKSATAAEAAQAKALLPKWRDGGVVFAGPGTLTGRRAYRMTKHPVQTVTTTATPAPVTPPPVAPPVTSAPPAAPPPASVPSGTTLPEVLVTADVPKGQPGPSPTAIQQVTVVRKGEGLAQVAKRLGQPATATSATVLRDANLPGPDGWYTKQDLSKGGLKKQGRAGGLQPGDRLFVPAAWTVSDVSRL